MNVFIDTNVLLSFYHLTSDDLEELKKLVVLVKGETIRLYITTQVQDELKRNRENKIADALKRFNDQTLPTQFPAICKHYGEYDLMKRLIRDFDKKRNELLEKLKEDIHNHNLTADLIIHELIDNADIVDVDQDIIEKSRLRMDLGNPPGKKGSLGDAVNWLALLNATPTGEDIHFISDDKDYVSPLKQNSFNEYLLQEWKEAITSELLFYKRLSAFFKKNFPEIKLASEAEKDFLIQKLSTSPYFSITRSLIQQLSNYSEFTNTQLNSLVRAAISNTQVYWIIADGDIHAFFQSLIKGHEDRIEPETLQILQSLLESETDIASIEPPPWAEYEIDEDDLLF